MTTRSNLVVGFVLILGCDPVPVTKPGYVRDSREGTLADVELRLYSGNIKGAVAVMESYWPAVARGDAEAPQAMREWAAKLEATPLRNGAVAMHYRRAR